MKVRIEDIYAEGFRDYSSELLDGDDPAKPTCCGTVNKKDISIDRTGHKPIRTFTYQCDNCNKHHAWWDKRIDPSIYTIV
jgi:hypothetical protein